MDGSGRGLRRTGSGRNGSGRSLRRTGSGRNGSGRRHSDSSDPEYELFLAAGDGCVEDVQTLLEQGTKTIYQNEDGETPLHSAAFNNHAEVVRMLLEAGADVHARNNDGNTALLFAAIRGHDDVAEALLRGGCDPNSKNERDYSVLMAAAYTGHTHVVRRLLAAGARTGDIDSCERVRDTDTPGAADDGFPRLASALHYAAAVGNEHGVTVLLDAGADVTLRDGYGRTALEYAQTVGHEKVGEILTRAVAAAEK